MRSVFGKYSALFLVGVIVQAVVVIIILLDTFRLTNAPARTLFDIISGGVVGLNIFRFIADWAWALSTFAVCLVLLVFFTHFREYRRSRALRRLHDWARNTVLTIADYRGRDPGLQELPQERYGEIRALMDKLEASSRIALNDAQVLGGKLDINTKKAVSMLFIVAEKLREQDDSAFEDLRVLQGSLSDVMISAFELLPR